MAKNPKSTLFSSWLRGQMVSADLSARRLGKTIDPEKPERGRRQVLRHLSGKHYPSARARRLYLDAFGLEGDPFTDEDEDSEQALYRDLRQAKALLAPDRTVGAGMTLAICSRCGRKGDAESHIRSGWRAVTNDDGELIRWEARKGAWFCASIPTCDRRMRLNLAQQKKDARRAAWPT